MSSKVFRGTGLGDFVPASLPVDDLSGAGRRGGVSPKPPALYGITHREAGGVAGDGAPSPGTPHFAWCTLHKIKLWSRQPSRLYVENKYLTIYGSNP